MGFSLWALSAPALAAPFQISLTITNPQAFTPHELQIVDQAVAQAESLWENVIAGYQPGISLTGLQETLTGTSSGLASSIYTGTTIQQGYHLSTGGTIQINVDAIEQLADYQGSGLNFIGDILAHEMGHTLGIGTLWVDNGLYVDDSGRYTGQYGLAAYRAEFNPNANYVPVELAGGPGTANSHWDQIMRSSPEEGNPADPYSLSPSLGIIDAQGRDFASELMTGALDPDYGHPFLSNTTIQSLRDLGYVVVPEPESWLLLLLGVGAVLAIRPRRASWH